MRFFTAQLYRQFNSANDAEADAGDEAWEQALDDYERHLKKVRSKMPPGVRRLADELCLHDAECVQFGEQGKQEVALLALRQEDKMIILVYLLWNRVRKTRKPRAWEFSSRDLHWLYDEVDVDPRRPGGYWHRVLLSDGSEIAIPFFDVWIQTVAFEKPALPKIPRRA